MLRNPERTPWPYFGGKADAAPAVWAALGDCENYAEPFAGSLAVLLRRPHPANRTAYVETVNDLDGLLCNAWRAMKYAPREMAEAASWPVCEADMHARHLALLRWKADRNLERLMGDPEFFDAKMAGWWAWGQSLWIGSGWCSGSGPWVIGADGRIVKREDKAAAGVHRKMPDVSSSRGVALPSTREPGVRRKIPYLTGNGQGVNNAHAREPGVLRQVPFLSSSGRGATKGSVREPGVGDFHPMVMPELLRWFEFLSARLRHVRILNGDWKRAVTDGALKVMPVRMGDGHAGVFLDPPYGDVREADLYAHDSLEVADEVREWCKAKGDDPKLRIVLAGFDTEHAELEAHGWRVVEWYRSGFLKGGMRNVGGAGKSQQRRERLWLSPHCLDPAKQKQGELF